MRLIFAAEERLTADTLADLRRTVSDLRAQNADLLATVLALKTQGAVVPTQGLKPRERDGVSAVIAEQAGSNSRLRSQLGRYARELLASGADEGEVIERLRVWDEASDGVAD